MKQNIKSVLWVLTVAMLVVAMTAGMCVGLAAADEEGDSTLIRDHGWYVLTFDNDVATFVINTDLKELASIRPSDLSDLRADFEALIEALDFEGMIKSQYVSTAPCADLDDILLYSLPEGFDLSDLPEGFDPNNYDLGDLPEGFDPNDLPDGFDPNDYDPSDLPEGFDPGTFDPDNFDPSTIDLSNITLGDVQDFLEHYFSGEDAKEKIETVLSGSYDAFIKSKIAEETDYTYEEIAAKVSDLAADVIAEIYADEPEKVEEMSAKMENKMTELVEAVEEAGGVVEITVKDMLNALRALKVNGTPVYENGYLKRDNIVAILKALPRPSEIATMQDFTLSYDLAIVTDFGTREFQLVIKLVGNESRIRRFASEFSSHVVATYADGQFNADVTLPRLATKALAKALNSDRVPQRLRDKYLDAQGQCVADWVDMVNDMTLAEWVDLLRELDFNSIFAQLGNAETLVRHLIDYIDFDRLTKANFDRLMAKLLDVANNYTEDNVADLIHRFLGVDLNNNADYLRAKAKLDSLLARIHWADMDLDLLYHYLDFDRYADRDLDAYLDRLATYTDLYAKLVRGINRVYDRIPARYQTLTLLDLYLGEGVFEYADSVYIDYERWLTRISPDKGGWIATYIEEDGLNLAFDVILRIPGISLVTYQVQEDVQVQGLLAQGVDVAKFARPQDVDGYEVLYWVDAQGNRIDQVPDHDVVLYAVKDLSFELEMEVEGEPDKVYDGEEVVMTAVNDYASYADWTYEWYCDGQLLEEATEASLAVSHIEESGHYLVKAIASDPYDPTYFVERTAETDINIIHAFIDCAEAVWEYTDALIYNGEEQSVLVANIPEYVEVDYEGNAATDAGTYLAKAVARSTNDYDIVNWNVGDLDWTIAPYVLDVEALEVEWDYEEPFVYDGQAKTVSLLNLPEFILIEYIGNTAVNAGDYSASVEVIPGNNYDASDLALLYPFDWSIEQAEFDMSEAQWVVDDQNTHAGALFEEDVLTVKAGQDYALDVTGLPEGLTLASIIYGEGAKTYQAGQLDVVATFDYDSDNYKAPVFGSAKVVLEAWDLTYTLVLEGFQEDTDGAYKATYDQNLHIFDVLVNQVDWIADFEAAFFEEEQVLCNARLEWTDVNSLEATLVVNAKRGEEIVATASADYTIILLPFKPNADDVVWNYPAAGKIYNGAEQEVLLTAVPELLGEDEITITYQGNKATDAGTYNASFLATASDNYDLSELNAVGALSWKIHPLTVDVSGIAWGPVGNLVYDGAPKSVALVGLDSVALLGDDELPIDFDGTLQAIAAGDYNASVTLGQLSNYTFEGWEVDDLEWSIAKATYDMSNVAWNHPSLTIDQGDTFEPFALVGLPEGVTATYVITYNDQEVASFDAVGEYVITAVLSQEDTANYEIATFAETAGLTVNEKVIPGEELQLTLTSLGDVIVTFDGNTRTIGVQVAINLQEPVTYAYSWTKDNVAINTNASSLTVRGVQDSGTYRVTVTATLQDGREDTDSRSINVRISPLALDMSRVNWNYLIDPSSFVYNGEPHTVELSNLPALIGGDQWSDYLTYAGQVSGSTVGDYLASFAIEGMSNYTYSNHVERNLAWSIRKGNYDLSQAAWRQSHITVSEGGSYEFGIDNLPEGVILDGFRYVDAQGRRIERPAMVGEYLVMPLLRGADRDNYNPPEWNKDPAFLTIQRGTDHKEYYDTDGTLLLVVSKEGGLDANQYTVTRNFRLPRDLDFGDINDGAASLVSAYQITTTDTIDPNTNYEVKIFVPASARGRKLHAVYIDEQGKVQEMNGTLNEDGFMVFYTNHFSIYGVAAEDKAPKSLAWIWIVVAVAILLLVIVICAVIGRARRNKKEDEPKTEEPQGAVKPGEDKQAKEQDKQEKPQVVANVVPLCGFTCPYMEQFKANFMAAQARQQAPAARPKQPAPAPKPKQQAAPVAKQSAPVANKPKPDAPIANPLAPRPPVKAAPHDTLDRSMKSRLIQADERVQTYYEALKNAALSYEKVGDREAWAYETFNVGRSPVMRVRIQNNILFAYFALDPNEVEEKYRALDASEYAAYAKIPTMVRVSSETALKKALKLLAAAMAKAGAVKGPDQHEKYRFKYEKDAALVKKGLIRINKK